jgi:hypothetical protein
MNQPNCHEPFDFSAVEWAVDQPGADVAASFLGSFKRCPLTCQDRGRDVAAADVDATVLVVFALISTAIALQGDDALGVLVESQPVPARVRSVFATVMEADFVGARDTVRTSLAEAGEAERRRLIEWWANTAAMPIGQVRDALAQFMPR